MAEETAGAQAAGEGMTPGEFFGQVVPGRLRTHLDGIKSRIDKLQREYDDLMGVDAVIRVCLTGEGAETLFLHLKDGGLAVSKDAPSEQLMTVTQSVEDWRASATGSIGAQFDVFGGGPGGEQAGQYLLTKGKVERLKQIKGTIQFVITDVGDGGEWKVLTTFGPGDPPETPQTTVTVANQDSQEIAAGKLNPQAAFMAGKIKIAGDMGLAMQVGMIMMGP